MILPMFPIGSVVFPYTAIPLRIFEPRYQILIDRVIEDDSTFGMVLIERGFEVGGGDQRFGLGTMVRVAAATEPDQEGHRTVVVAGIGRIEINRWLPDDPHPVAEVTELPDIAESIDDDLEPALCSLRRVLALASELGADVSGIGVEFADDAVAASYQVAALCPVTPLDSQQLLAASGPGARLRMATAMLDERAALLRIELGGG